MPIAERPAPARHGELRFPRRLAGPRPPALPGLEALALAAALALFLALERWIAGVAGFPLDDSWIHLHFARNLAEGEGFSYNRGFPVAGSTAPLWTLLLGALFAVLGPEPLWAKAAGVVATIGAALLTRRLAREWTGDGRLGLLAALLTALAGPLVWGALSGMEVSLAALLVTAALVSHTVGRHGIAASLLGLGVLTRPESALVAPLVWLAGPLDARRSLLFVGAGIAALGPWVAFNLATAGTPWPATAAAKVEGGLVGLLSGVREPLGTALLARPWQFEVQWVGWLFSLNALLPVLMLPGLLFLWRRHGRRVGLPAAALLLHPVGMALLAPYRGPGFQEGRYSIHLLPLAIVVAVSALGWIGSRDGWAGIGSRASGPGGGGPVPRRSPARVLRGVLPALLLGAALAALWPAGLRYAWAVQNIETMQVHIGHWVARRTPPGARVALNDVGAIAYVSRREVLDLMGLVTPEVHAYRRQGEAGLLRYLEQACPDYLIIFPDWFPRLARMADRFTPLYRVRLERNTVAGADEMVVYRASLGGCPAPAASGPGARPGPGVGSEAVR